MGVCGRYWLMSAILIFYAQTTQTTKFSTVKCGKEGELINGLNVVLGSSPRYGDFTILIFDRCPEVVSVGDMMSSWGVSVFQVAKDPHHANITRAMMSPVIHQARQLREVSKPTTIVLMSDDPEILDAFAYWALKSRLLVWSTRLLVLTRLTLSSLTNIRHTLSMTNSMLLLISQTSTISMSLYVDMPYSPENTNPIPVGFWSPEMGLHKTSPFPFFFNKFSKLAHRPRLVVSRVVIGTEKTITIDDPDYPGEKKIVGVNAENQLIETLAKAMNFTTKFKRPADGHWGYLDTDGTWTGMIGNVHRGEADIALGLFTMTPQRFTVVDFTFPVAISYARILSARRTPKANIWGFLLPLTTGVWLGILSALVILVIVMLAPSLLPHHSLNMERLSTNAFNCIRVFLQQDLIRKPGYWWWERMALGVWMIITLVLMESYSGVLVSLLAIRTIPEPIQGLQDLIDNPVQVLTVKGTAEEQAFRTATSGLKKQVWDLTKQNRIRGIPADQMEEVTDILLSSFTAIINLEVYQKKRMAKEFSRRGKCVFSLSRSRYIPSLESMAGAKNNPLIPALGHKVMQLTEAGLYNHWQTVFFPNLTSCLNSPTKIAITSALAIRNIWGMFMLLAGGFILGLIFLALEYCLRGVLLKDIF